MTALGHRTWEVAGLSDVMKQLDAVIDTTKARAKAMHRAARRAFNPVVHTVKVLCRVDTGDLRDSARTALVSPKSGDVVVSVGLAFGKLKARDEIEFEEGTVSLTTVRSVGWRWHFLEKGTSRSKAYPFIRPAFDQHVDGLPQAFANELQKDIDKAIAAKRAET